MSNLFLIYISNRSDPTDRMLVHDIAIEASQTNRERGISGVLMAVGSYFLQVLEGNTNNVEELLEKIGKDSRHRDMRVIYKGELPDRIFGRWSMGCVQAGETAEPSEDYLQLVQDQIQELCENLTQENGERLRDLIVQIPQMLSEGKLQVA